MTYRKIAQFGGGGTGGGILRKLALTFILCLCSVPLGLSIEGCPSAPVVQQTTADLLIVAGNSVASYYTSIGDTADADKATTFAQTVAADASSFTAGTKSQVAIQLIQDFEGILSIAAPSGNGVILIDLALSTAESALQIIEANTGAAAPPATPAIQARVSCVNTSDLANPPQSVKEYKARWNQDLAANPVPGLKPLK